MLTFLCKVLLLLTVKNVCSGERGGQAKVNVCGHGKKERSKYFQNALTFGINQFGKFNSGDSNLVPLHLRRAKTLLKVNTPENFLMLPFSLKMKGNSKSIPLLEQKRIFT